jgi:hypothetical protein
MFATLGKKYFCHFLYIIIIITTITITTSQFLLDFAVP